MSKRISKKRARELRDRELELQQMQAEGKPLPPSTRRHNKYLLQVKHREGYLSYLIARYKSHGHVKEAKKLEELEGG